MKTRKLAYLTDSITTMELSAGDDLLLDCFPDNIQVDIIDWETRGIDWSQYSLELIRTTWNYMEKFEKYLQVIEEIASQTKLINSVEIVQWNINKKYLIELSQAGVETIPTQLHERITKENIEGIFEAVNKGEGIIIKPTVGASSLGIQKLSSPFDLIELQQGEWLVQPFQKSIQEKGEYSLFYFNQKYSHGINKLPKPGEFRSQEEYDSIVTKIDASEELKLFGEKALKALPFKTHYARVDIILNDHDEPQLVELEMIEPCLFFKYVPSAAVNFKNYLMTLLKE